MKASLVVLLLISALAGCFDGDNDQRDPSAADDTRDSATLGGEVLRQGVALAADEGWRTALPDSASSEVRSAEPSPTGGMGPAEGTWYHDGGEDHANIATNTISPLDVVSRFSFLRDGETLPIAFSMGVVPTRTDFAAIVVDRAEDACRVAFLGEPWSEAGSRGPLFPCDAMRAGVFDEDFAFEGTTATAYDAVSDLLLTCTASMGELPVLRALDGTSGEPVWDMLPEEVGIVTPQAPRVDYVHDPWYCVGVSLDREARMGVVALSTYGDRNAVVAFDVDTGDPKWTRTITPAALGAAASGQDLAAPSMARDGFVAWSAMLTTSGVIVTGSVAQLGGFTPAVVWLDRDGNIVGWVADDHGADEQTARLLTMSGVAGSGRLGVVALGDELVVIEPSSVAPVVHPLADREGDPADPIEWWPTPAWWADHLLVGLTDSLTDYDSSTGQPRWTLPNPAGWQPAALFVTPPTDVYMLAARTDGDGAAGALFRVGLHDGALRQQIPVPAEALAAERLAPSTNALEWGVRALPLVDGRVLVVEDSGHVTVLGAATSPPPQITLTDVYPQEGSPVSVTLGAPAEIDRIVLAWGDGSIQELSPGETVQHSYAATGPHMVRATAVYPDRSTATAERLIEVGGAPPQALNLVQRAFAPENQDLTFGVLGIAVALLGGLIAIASRRRKRGILQRELAAIEAVYQDTAHDPAECETALTERKTHCRALLAEGRVDETQFAVLTERVEELGRDLRVSTLDQRFQFLPHGMVLALRDMLGDGRISAWEREHLVRALEDDTVLSREQKSKVQALIDGWFRRDARGDRA